MHYAVNIKVFFPCMNETWAVAIPNPKDKKKSTYIFFYMSELFTGVSEDDDAAFADGILANNSSSRSSNRLPPRPRYSKSPRPYTPTLEAKSPSCTSGHQSAGSKFSVSSPSASPSSMGKCSSPNNIDHPLISSKRSSEEAIAKLRKEITALRERFVNRQKDWAEVKCYQKMCLEFALFFAFYCRRGIYCWTSYWKVEIKKIVIYTILKENVFSCHCSRRKSRKYSICWDHWIQW